MTTAADGKNYRVAHYNLDAILAVGYRVRSPRGMQFRRWASTILSEYLRKGFVLDDQRLKNPDGRADYFDEMLARIRDIRASQCVIAYVTTFTPIMYERVENVSKYHSP